MEGGRASENGKVHTPTTECAQALFATPSANGLICKSFCHWPYLQLLLPLALSATRSANAVCMYERAYESPWGASARKARELGLPQYVTFEPDHGGFNNIR